MNMLFKTSALLFAFIATVDTASAACRRESEPQATISGINSVVGYTWGVQNIRVNVTDARVTDNGSTSGCHVYSTVTLRIDNQYVGSSYYTWNTNQWGEGRHRISAEVTDNHGGRSTTYTDIIVRNNFVRAEVFNLEFYIWANPDVAAAFGGDPGRTLAHWLYYGVNEGRWGSPIYNGNEYLAINGDVNAAFGGNRAAALDHYIQHGLHEGRQTTSLFNVRHYMGVHGDLQAAFGATNWPAATNHYLVHGVNEGRQATAGFSGGSYLARHGDLQAAFGWNPRRAIAHWITNGAAEGRNPAP